MFTQQKKLPLAVEIKSALPLDDQLNSLKLKFDEQLRQNMQSKQKLVVVCGPCSADDPVAVGEYVSKLKRIADKCPNLLVVARIYTTKPRSNGLGYKGLCFGDDGKDIAKGIALCRQMMISCIKAGLPVADELLYPELYQYFDDLVSYSFVGARSSEDSLHRAFASSLDVCCGVKNSTDGDVDKLLQSLQAISLPTVFPHSGCQMETSGCKFAHVVLRGGSLDGKYLSNIDKSSVAKLKQGLQSLGLNDFVMADLSHANSQKVAQNQIDNAKMAILDENINGIMMESYLSDGSDGNTYGVSKTDQCLGFDDTAELLLMLNKQFEQRNA